MRLDYYAGAYGPTIRIETDSIAELGAFRELFVSIEKGQQQSIDVARIDGWSVSNFGSLLLERCDGSPCLTWQNSALPPHFVWRVTPDDCIRYIALIDGLLDGSGHQYLTREGIDVALVELSFRE